MKVCHQCGCRDNALWQQSRFDYGADYMDFAEAQQIHDDANENFDVICLSLSVKRNYEPCVLFGYTYYRRGKKGKWLYRVANEDFRVPVEKRRAFSQGKQVKLPACLEVKT